MVLWALTKCNSPHRASLHTHHSMQTTPNNMARNPAIGMKSTWNWEVIMAAIIVTMVFVFQAIGHKTAMNTSIRRLSSENNLMSSEKVTIRVNTFRRNDLLQIFLKSFNDCPVVEQIQVVWSDTKSSPPRFISDYKRAVAEVHHNNSLSNRFIPLLPISSEVVLSIDDDIVMSCDDLDFLVHTWTMNKGVLVGISPRITTYDAVTGLARYKNWQYTWWNGIYNIVLTKAALLHKKYLYEYSKVIPKEFLTFIDENRNCEDLAMAYLVSIQSNAPPVWTKVTFYDIASGGISSGGTHFDIRSECVQRLEKLSGYKYPWHIGYQKIVRLSSWNSLSLLWSKR